MTRYIFNLDQLATKSILFWNQFQKTVFDALFINDIWKENAINWKHKLECIEDIFPKQHVNFLDIVLQNKFHFAYT